MLLDILMVFVHGFLNVFICFSKVRKRPLNKKELARKEDDIVTVNDNSLTVHEPKLKVLFHLNTITGRAYVLGIM